MGRDNEVRRRSRSRERSRPKHKRSKYSRSPESRDRHKRRSHKQSSRSRSRTPSRKKKDKKTDRKKHKSKKKRYSSGASSNSDEESAASDSSTELLEKLDKERRELLRKRKEEKARMKALETPEEKRARRLVKKAEKARRDRERMGWDQEYVHYTNEDNPYGDSNLTSAFRWQKKLEKSGLDKVDDHQLQKMQRVKYEEQKRELEKVKQRRLEREREREERRAMMELEERDRENDKFTKWQDEEDTFHLQQARLRSNIRILDGRAKPIDLLAKYISAEEEMDAVEMHEPYTYLNGLTVSDLEDLLVDIDVYEKIDLDRNREFWADIITIVHDELHKLRKMDMKGQYEEAAERRQGINKAVADDVQGVFKGKSSDQLSQLQLQIETKLSQRAEGVDVGYWESLLSQLKAHLARARLRDKHSENLRRKLQLLKAEQGNVSSSEAAQDVAGPSSSQASVTSSAEENEEEEETMEVAHDIISPALEEYGCGNYSPKYITLDDLEPGTIVMTEGEEVAKREIDQDRALHTTRGECHLYV